MKQVCRILVIACISVHAYAQISIQAGDLTKYNRAAGTYQQSTSGSVQVDLKQPGTGMYWDFSALNMGSPIEFDYTFQKIDGMENPYFPQANYVMIEHEEGNPGWAATSYVKITDEKLQIIGKKMEDGSGSSQSQHGDNYYYPLALEYGAKWRSVRYDTLALWGVIENQSYYNEVDACGTVKLPAGEFDCLRVRTSIVQEDGSYKGLKYYFLSKDLLLLAIVTGQPNDTTYNFSNAVGVMMYTGFTGLRRPHTQTGTPSSFRLGQNFPNPFNPATTISFDVPQLTYGELAVYTVTGKKVKTLYHGQILPGTHKAVWDGTDEKGRQAGTGVYIYRFASRSYSHSRRMLLIR